MSYFSTFFWASFALLMGLFLVTKSSCILLAIVDISLPWKQNQLAWGFAFTSLWVVWRTGLPMSFIRWWWELTKKRNETAVVDEVIRRWKMLLTVFICLVFLFLTSITSPVLQRVVGSAPWSGTVYPYYVHWIHSQKQHGKGVWFLKRKSQ